MSAIFAIGDYIVEPAHGLGKLTKKVTQSFAGSEVECFEVQFEKDELSMFIPVNKLEKKGIRALISKSEVEEVYSILKEDSKGLCVIWSKRSREYTKRILSGDVKVIAEVVRDLYKNTNNPNRSYSESVIYEKAFYRVASEVAAVMNIEYKQAETKVNSILSKYHETHQSSFEEDENIHEEVELDESMVA